MSSEAIRHRPKAGSVIPRTVWTAARAFSTASLATVALGGLLCLARPPASVDPAVGNALVAFLVEYPAFVGAGLFGLAALWIAEGRYHAAAVRRATARVVDGWSRETGRDLTPAQVEELAGRVSRAVRDL